QRIRTAIRSRRDVQILATLCISVAIACTPGVTRTLRYIDYCIRAVVYREVQRQRIRTADRSRPRLQTLATLCTNVAIGCPPGVLPPLRYIDYCIRSVSYPLVRRQRIRTAIRSRRDVQILATLCISVAIACTPGVTRTLRYIDYCIRAVVYREVQRQRIRT